MGTVSTEYGCTQFVADDGHTYSGAICKFTQRFRLRFHLSNWFYVPGDNLRPRREISLRNWSPGLRSNNDSYGHPAMTQGVNIVGWLARLPAAGRPIRLSADA
jgi:hypothetical protein